MTDQDLKAALGKLEGEFLLMEKGRYTIKTDFGWLWWQDPYNNEDYNSGSLQIAIKPYHKIFPTQNIGKHIIGEFCGEFKIREDHRDAFQKAIEQKLIVNSLVRMYE